MGRFRLVVKTTDSEIITGDFFDGDKEKFIGIIKDILGSNELSMGSLSVGVTGNRAEAKTEQYLFNPSHVVWVKIQDPWE